MSPSPLQAGLRMALVAVIAVVLQVGLLSQLRVFGVGVELPVIVAMAAGMAGGADKGALAGFGIGLLHDVFLTTPLGLSALAYACGAYLIGLTRPALSGSIKAITVAAITAGTVLGLAIFVLVGVVFGQSQLVDAPLLEFAAVATAFALIAALPVARVGAWALGAEPDVA